ncbi:putative spermidine/putrescine transport system substrate-binding protein [Pseudorhizobium tarimense]|uniref:Spermidine/putrescine transport system substrate-binding protein n=1 Tax=Pseudorhizobium tarimense TaxID=1079109 RepID=A0ABV2HBZ6_9HYPH|nr:extracellular solute-binding protein [Pseudorhizobium tarimense]MCJ8521151.1 extracellular solute-binding protein [Pseudorhizobium tarimense]
MKTSRQCALAVGFIAAWAPDAISKNLIVNSYGGPYEEIIRERIIEPFEKKFGVNVTYDAVGSASQDYAKTKATGGRPGFDVVVMTASQSLDGCREGLLQPLTAAAVPNISSLNPQLRAIAGECGAVHELQYLSLVWRKDKLPEGLSSWSDLLDERLSGKVMLPTFQNVMAAYLISVMSVTNGGDLLDEVDPGFEAVAALAKGSLGFEQSSAVMENYIKDGRAWAMPFWNGRAQLLMESGLPVDYVRPKEGTVPLIATLNVPIGSENKEAALEFVNFWLEKTSQEAWVTGYKVGSARPDIDVPDEVRARQITTETDLNALLLPDLSALSQRLPQWGARWEREVVTQAR